VNRTASGLQKRERLEEILPRRQSPIRFVMEHPNQSGPSAYANVQSQRMPSQIDDTIVTLKIYETMFLEEYIPSGTSFEGDMPGAWFLQSVCINNPGQALNTAKEALFLSRIGMIRNDRSLNIQGKLRYGKALQEVQRALMNSHEAMKDETLSACQVLSLYEVSYFQRKKRERKNQFKICANQNYRLYKQRSPLCRAKSNIYRVSSNY